MAAPPRDAASGVRTWRRLSAAWLVIGTAVSVVAGMWGDTTRAALLTPLVVATPLLILTGLRVHAPARPRTWYVLVAATIVLPAGLLQRALAEGAPPAATPDVSPLGTALVVLGYALLLLSAVVLIADRRAHDTPSTIDAMLVVAGAFAPIAVLLVLPALERRTDSVFVALELGLFPLLDVTLLYMLARVTFTSGQHITAMRLLSLAAALLLVGDVLWGLALVGRVVVPVPVLDGVFPLALVAVGGAALHPSMSRIAESPPRRVERLRRGRLLAIVAALGTPALLVASLSLESVAARLAVAASILAGAMAAAERARRAVAEHAANEDRLAYLATHDPLTNLPNRRRAVTLLDTALARVSSSVSVLFIDVDRFKLVNDAWGHHVGDELIRAVAARLRRTCEPRGVVAHVSGDEFLVILEREDSRAAHEVGQAVLSSFASSFHLSIGELFVTASMGLATALPHRVESSAEDLVRDADIALRAAKQAGRNRVVPFDSAMRRPVADRAELERDLRLALERGEFDLHYQPIVGLGDLRVVGVEALLRWQRPDHGLVESQRFVSVLEELDLVLDVGEQVLERAVRQLASSPDDDTYIAVNLAARQVRHPTLAATVGRLLHTSGVDPSRLVLELTESLLIEDSPVVRATVQGLAVLGVHLVIDDFGTGYSSLQYLTRFPVSAVKIDRSFVQRVTDDDNVRAIVAAVVGMSHALDMSVIAEGVETVEQRRVLTDLGCDAMQGWLGGRPRAAVRSGPVEDLASLRGTPAGQSSSLGWSQT